MMQLFSVCRVLCVLIAVGNLLAMALVIYEILEDAFEEPLMTRFISPCFANIALAVLLIVGVIKEQISLVRLFKMFFYAQLIFALLMVVFGHRLLDMVKWPNVEKINFIIMFVVCGIELIIVSSTIEAMRKRALRPNGLVVYMPTPRTV